MAILSLGSILAGATMAFGAVAAPGFLTRGFRASLGRDFYTGFCSDFDALTALTPATLAATVRATVGAVAAFRAAF